VNSFKSYKRDNFSNLALHPNHYGKTDLLELRIELQPGAVPKRSKVRPLNPDQRANLKEQLDEWIQQGIIEPANSPWASPLVPVKKKDRRMRWVTDLRQLNDVTIKDAYHPGEPAKVEGCINLHFYRRLWGISCHTD